MVECYMDKVDQCRLVEHAIKVGALDSESLLYGETRSRYKGIGYEFVDYRPYFYGDDVRHVDWRVTARYMTNPYTLNLYVKEYISERRVDILHVLDLHESLLYWDKLWILVYGLTLMVSLARKLQDNTYLIVVSSDETWIAPSSDPGEVLEYLKYRVCRWRGIGRESGLKRVVEIIPRFTKIRGVIVYTDYAVKPENYRIVGRIVSTINASLAYMIATNIYEINPPIKDRVMLTFTSPTGVSLTGYMDEVYERIKRHVLECRAMISLSTFNYLEIPSMEWARENKHRILFLYQGVRSRNILT